MDDTRSINVFLSSVAVDLTAGMETRSKTGLDARGNRRPNAAIVAGERAVLLFPVLIWDTLPGIARQGPALAIF